MSQIAFEVEQMEKALFRGDVAQTPVVNIDVAATLAIKHMPLNDLMFLVAQEIERRARDPGTHCPEGVYGWDDWSADAGRTANEIKDIARRLEREGLV
ncbi:MAG: hypothetical protein ACK51V_00445 [bacterium]|jgi:hypothetical protein|nr:hypothetical protein [Betaproteobacteria bacterium]